MLLNSSRSNGGARNGVVRRMRKSNRRSISRRFANPVNGSVDAAASAAESLVRKFAGSVSIPCNDAALASTIRATVSRTCAVSAANCPRNSSNPSIFANRLRRYAKYRLDRLQILPLRPPRFQRVIMQHPLHR